MSTLSAQAHIQENKSISLLKKFGAYFELGKPRIAFMLFLTSAAGFYIGSGSKLELALFANSMTAITMLAFGVATLNQYLERDLDKLMKRTSKRPIPTGRVSASEALFFGIVLCTAAELYLFFAVNTLTAMLGIFVIIGYVFLYTPLKTRTTASTAIGALPGAMPPLMGWTAVANEITLSAWFLFALLFFWQFPHFLSIAWIYKEQYAKVGIKMLPVVEKDGKITAWQITVFTVLLALVSFAPFFFGISGLIYLVGAGVLGIWFLIYSIQAAIVKSREKARKLLFVSVLYLPLIFALMVLNQ